MLKAAAAAKVGKLSNWTRKKKDSVAQGKVFDSLPPAAVQDEEFVPTASTTNPLAKEPTTPLVASKITVSAFLSPDDERIEDGTAKKAAREILEASPENQPIEIKKKWSKSGMQVVAAKRFNMSAEERYKKVLAKAMVTMHQPLLRPDHTGPKGALHPNDWEVFEKKYQNRVYLLEEHGLKGCTEKAIGSNQENDVLIAYRDDVNPGFDSDGTRVHGRVLSSAWAKNSGGALKCATNGNVPGLVECITERGEDPNQLDELGYTPIYIAALHGKNTYIKKLVELGANINLQTKDGRSAAHGAVIGRFPEILKTIYVLGGRVDLTDRNNSPPSHYAAQVNDIHCLLALGAIAPETLRQENTNGTTPIQIAAKSNCDKAVHFLAKIYPSCLNATDRSGAAAAHYAARLGNREAYLKLCELNACMCLPDCNGDTPTQLMTNRSCGALATDEINSIYYMGDPAPPAPEGYSDYQGRVAVRNRAHQNILKARWASQRAAHEAEESMRHREEVHLVMHEEKDAMKAMLMDTATGRRMKEQAHELLIKEQLASQCELAEKIKTEKARKVAQAKAAKRRMREVEHQRKLRLSAMGKNAPKGHNSRRKSKSQSQHQGKGHKGKGHDNDKENNR
jgi:hypothetical protein